jgi:hypothetical protein
MRRYSIYHGDGVLWARKDTLEEVVALIRSGEPRSMIAAIHPDERDDMHIEERDRRSPNAVIRRLTYGEALAELDERDPEHPDVPPNSTAPTAERPSGIESRSSSSSDAEWCGRLSQALRDVLYELRHDRADAAHDIASNILGRYDREAFPPTERMSSA